MRGPAPLRRVLRLRAMLEVRLGTEFSTAMLGARAVGLQALPPGCAPRAVAARQVRAARALLLRLGGPAALHAVLRHSARGCR